jgi:hypothetical protein
MKVTTPKVQKGFEKLRPDETHCFKLPNSMRIQFRLQTLAYPIAIFNNWSMPEALPWKRDTHLTMQDDVFINVPHVSLAVGWTPE